MAVPSSFRSVLLATAVCAASFSTPGWAQEAAKDGEIVVTARKRVESILKAPVIESVLTREMIEKAQIRNVNDLVTKTTSVLVGSSTPDVGSFITIRGVG